jgi:hypothetical protein
VEILTGDSSGLLFPACCAEYARLSEDAASGRTWVFTRGGSASDVAHSETSLKIAHTNDKEEVIEENVAGSSDEPALDNQTEKSGQNSSANDIDKFFDKARSFVDEKAPMVDKAVQGFEIMRKALKGFKWK